MTSSDGRRTSPGVRFPAFGEFVAIIALMMGVTAFSIDNLLPAFPLIRSDLKVGNANDIQLLISAYLIGFSVAQIVYGTISDVIGRKPALMGGLAIFAVGCVLAMVTDDFTVLLVARIIQGVGSAGARVLSVAVVRDRYQGRDMARVMSLAMMVFLTVPILAPAVGSLILLVGGWHLIFAAMLGLGIVLALWFGLRMPETLHPEYRVPFSVRAISAGIVLTVRTRRSLGYATGMGLMMGCLMSYIGLASQLFETDVYHTGAWFPLVFAAVAAVMAVSSFLNAKLVKRLGMHRLSHAGVIGFTLMGMAMAGCALVFDGRPPLLLFCGLLAVAQFLFSLTVPNFNSMAMEPLGAIAGTASSFIGFYTTLTAALLGIVVGRTFDGTVTSLSVAYLVLGGFSLLAVLWAERGRLFTSTRL